MPRKKHTPRPPRIRGSSFEVALRMAQRMYESKVERRVYLLQELERLDVEIPKLKVTLEALEQQLGDPRDKIPIIPASTQQIGERIKRQMARLEEIPAEVRAKLPPDSTNGMGSRFGEGDEFLPEIVGKEVVEKK